MAFSTTKSLAAWAGPINAGSGCLSCVTHCLRGKTHWFAREDATPYRNCTDPEPSWRLVSETNVGEVDQHDWFDYHGECRWGSTDIENPAGRYDVSDRNGVSGSFSFSKTYPADSDPIESLEGSAAYYHHFVKTTNCLSGVTGLPETPDEVHTTSTWTAEETRSHIQANTRSFGILTETATSSEETRTVVKSWVYFWHPDGDDLCDTYLCIDVDDRYDDYTETETKNYVSGETEDEATAGIDAAENDEDIWGADAEAQFPPSWCYGYSWADGWNTNPMSPDYMPTPAPASPLLKHTSHGRDVLRAKLAVEDSYYPGQSYSFAWSEVVRNLGYDAARSGTSRGRTVTTRDREISVEDAMTAPEDRLGSLDFGDSSWDSLGYDILIGATSSPFLAASLQKRSRMRVATLVPGVFTVRIKKAEGVIGDPESVVTTYATLTTSGATSADGTNSTASFDVAPSDNLKSVYVSVEWVHDADGNGIGQWLLLGKVREGLLGFRQLDHAELQADSQFYRRLVFSQVSTSFAESIPDPEDPPTEEEQECLDSLPWLDFSQSQTWLKEFTVADGTNVPWMLSSATGSAGDQSWTGEVSAFDAPAYEVPSEDGGWTVSATTAAAETQETPEDPEELNGAIWAEFDRVMATPNPYFGGTVLSVTRATSGSSAFGYASGDAQQSGLIYKYPAEAGTSLQIVNVHVAGA